MKKEMSEILIENFMPYAMTTISDRAVANVEDGLKPLHLKILYDMYRHGTRSDKLHKGCLAIVGNIAKIHGHGDKGIYDCLALLTEQNESLLHPYIDGEYGAFGKVYSTDKPSDKRYTSARLNKFADDTCFSGLNKNCVDFVGEIVNGEDLTYPKYLPITYPNILVKNNEGIAVGIKSVLPSYNLIEVCDLTENYIKNKDVEVSDYLKAPDFSSGGELIYNEKELKSLYSTGRGKVVLKSKYKYDEDNNIIDIYEIPYNTTANKIIESITKLIKTDNKFKNIIDVRDETGMDRAIGKERLSITIEVKKNTNIEKLMLLLFTSTPLQTSYSFICNVLVKQKPQLLGVKDILDNWLLFRKECITRELSFDVEKNKKELNKLYGLRTILLDIDKVIHLIRTSSTETEAMSKLINEFSLNQEQAEYISEIKLIKLNKEWILNKTKSIEDLESKIHGLQNTINSESEINNIIIEQLQEVKKKYGQPRKTDIIHEDTIQEISQEEFIEDYNCKLFLTKEGFFKKVALTSLRGSSTHKLKDEDYITHELDSTNKSTTLIFTSTGTCYKLYNNEVDDTKISNIGIHLKPHLQLQDDEYIVGMVTTSDYKENIYIGYENGKIACISGKSFETKTKRSKLDNSMCLDSPVVNIFKLDKDTEIVCKSDINKTLIVNSSKLNPKGTRNTQGVQVLKSKNDSKMSACYPLINVVEDMDYDYYRVNGTSGTGKYLRKEDRL